MKLWIDDIRYPPSNFNILSMNSGDRWIRSTNEAIRVIGKAIKNGTSIELIDIDHDAGSYAKYGGDYINILKYLEKIGCNYPIHIHSMNPVGIQNMRAIIEKNGWKEV